MAKAKTFQTHVGILICQVQEDKEHVVFIVADREKEILRTPVKSAATKCFDSLVKHYQERAIAEAVNA